MRTCAVVILICAVAGPAAADDWTDTPALVAAALGTVEDDLRACFGDDLPQRIGFIAARGDGGETRVHVPLYGIGHRGPTARERCLVRVIGRVTLPPLPPGIERVALAHVVTAPGASPAPPDAETLRWRDPAATLAPILDEHRAALAACDRRPRTVRLVLDRRRGRTRVWLPAWQFHSRSGDGTTPPRERTVKTCLRRALRGWSVPVLPRTMAELQLAVPVAP